TVKALPATSASDATTSTTARRCGFIDMVHLRSWGEPMYHSGGRARAVPDARVAAPADGCGRRRAGYPRVFQSFESRRPTRQWRIGRPPPFDTATTRPC